MGAADVVRLLLGRAARVLARHRDGGGLRIRKRHSAVRPADDRVELRHLGSLHGAGGRHGQRDRADAAHRTVHRHDNHRGPSNLVRADVLHAVLAGGAGDGAVHDLRTGAG